MNYRKSQFYKCPSKETKGRYDILIVDRAKKEYEIYLNAPDTIPLMEVDDCVLMDAISISSEQMAEKTRELKKEKYRCVAKEDVSYYPNRWDAFYTDVDKNGNLYDDDQWDLVDQIEINLTDGEYCVIEGVNDMVTDGYGVFDEELFSTYVSREMFDFLVEACKAKGLKDVGDDDEDEL